jgi:hypothetical protein
MEFWMRFSPLNYSLFFTTGSNNCNGSWLTTETTIMSKRCILNSCGGVFAGGPRPVRVTHCIWPAMLAPKPEDLIAYTEWRRMLSMGRDSIGASRDLSVGFVSSTYIRVMLPPWRRQRSSSSDEMNRGRWLHYMPCEALLNEENVKLDVLTPSRFGSRWRNPWWALAVRWTCLSELMNLNKSRAVSEFASPVKWRQPHSTFGFHIHWCIFHLE